MATSSDIQRLQDEVYQAGTDVTRLRSNDASAAARLQDELDELRDEVIYLKVKLRKEGSVTRTEYADLRDRVDQLAARARGETGGASSPSTMSGQTGSAYGSGSASTPSGTSTAASGTRSSGTYGTGSSSQTGSSQAESGVREVPVGAELDVRLQTPLHSDTAQPEQRFEATTAADLMGKNGEVLIPAGSLVRGVVSDVKRAGRVERTSSLTLAFDQITVRGRSYPIRATVAPFEGEGVRGDAAKIGTGAGVGAIIGGILGGFKGALAGILIGGGGVIAATEGQDVNLEQGTVLRLRFDSPLQLK
jgi:hypothetical protein